MKPGPNDLVPGDVIVVPAGERLVTWSSVPDRDGLNQYFYDAKVVLVVAVDPGG